MNAQGQYLLGLAGPLRRCVLPAAVVLLVVGGGWAAKWRGELADQEQRQWLLAQAVTIARTFNSENVKALSFTEADRTNPNFQRLRGQMRAYAQVLGQRSLYSVAARDGNIVFGPESLEEDDPQASPPGRIYEQPTPELRNCFRTANAFTEGPVADEYGVFVTGFAPVKDPHTGQVLLVVGLDIEAEQWQASIAWQRRIAMLIALGLVALLLGGVTLVRRRQRLPIARRERWRYAETYLTVVYGCVVTALLVLVAHDGETLSRRFIFSQLAAAQAELVRGFFEDVRDHQLATLARFVEGDERLSREEFQHFSEVMIRRLPLAGMGWAPRVLAAEKEAFEEQQRSQGFEGYCLFQLDSAGHRQPVSLRDEYVPIAYCEPYAEVSHTVGFDLRSAGESHWHAIEDAVQTRLATATDLVHVVGIEDPVLLVYEPIFADGATPAAVPSASADAVRWRGVIFIAVRLEALFDGFSAPADSAGEASTVQLYQLRAGNSARFLVSSSRQTSDRRTIESWMPGRSSGLSAAFPVFAFGQTYTLVVRPGPAFLRTHPARAWWTVGLTGLFLTSMMTVLIGFLSQRRTELERQVQARTAELRASEESYRRQFADNSVVMLLIDPERGCIVDANAAAATFYGYAQERLRGMPIFEINTLAQPQVAQAMASISAERGQRFEFQHRLADGSVREVEVSSSLIQFGDRRVLHSIVYDVTPRKQAKAALLRSERFARATMDALAEHICVLDEAGTLLAVNQAWWDYGAANGATQARVAAGANYLAVCDAATGPAADAAAAFAAGIRAVLRGERDKFVMEYACHSPSQERWFLGSVTRFPDEDLGRVVVAHEDVTERRHAAAVVAAEADRRRILFEQAPDGIVILDPATARIVEFNEAAHRQLGYSREEFARLSVHDLEAVETPADVRQRIADVSRTGHADFETQQRTRQGEVRHVHVTAQIIPILGRPVYYCFWRDITERKRAEAALLDANRNLEQATLRAKELAVQAKLASIAKSEFLANMSHEIRTPLNGVIGMTGLLLDTALSAEQQKYAEIVRTSGESLLALVNDILDFSKIEARKLDLEALDFELRGLLEDTAEMLAVKAQAKGLELTCLVAPEVPTLLRGDPGRLRQVLVNLGGNAVKFTERGEVVLRVSREAEHATQMTLRFTVSDSGIGIPEDRQRTLFSLFTQVDGSTTRKYGGTGLGLAISKQLAELMGGEIGCDSQPGRGSTFWFTAVFGPPSGEPRREAASPADLSGTRVLVVDDFDTNRLLVTTLLQGWGCRFAEAADGAAALAQLRQAAETGDPFRVAVLDMHMPGMDGAELGRQIKRDPVLAQTQLIMMTSLGVRDDGAAWGQTIFAECLTKPLRQAQLRECLARVVGQADRSAAAGVVKRQAATGTRNRLGRILVAEDNPTNQLVAVGILQKLGFRADAVADGREAVEALRARPYDLVLMDCQMPEMDGFEATRQIRAGASGRRATGVPIIAMTAHALKGDRQRCLDAGMSDYLPKPVEREDLAELLDRWLPPEAEDAARDALPPAQDSAGPAPAEQGVPGRRQHATASESADGGWPDAVPAEIVIFGRQAFLERLDHDQELAEAIVVSFLTDLPAQLDQLAADMTAGHCDQVERLAHKLKGAAATLEATAVRHIAAAMEIAAKAGDLEQLAESLPQLRRQCERLQTTLADWWPC